MIKAAAKALRIDDAILHRTVPFALFMAFIGLEDCIRLATHNLWLTVPDLYIYLLYPIKALSVATVLFVCRKHYQEIRWVDLLQVKTTAAVCLTGLATFLIWLSLDWTFSVTGPPNGFNPTLIPHAAIRLIMTGTRVAGAVLVVPLMEELFWRSFLLRYLINSDFKAVPIGRLTFPSFLVVTLLFGLEHHLLIAGMSAGAIYNLVLHQTRSLAQCVFAHAVTNLALACYVLYTSSWHLW